MRNIMLKFQYYDSRQMFILNFLYAERLAISQYRLCTSSIYICWINILENIEILSEMWERERENYYDNSTIYTMISYYLQNC